MVTIKENPTFQRLWSETQDWIRTNTRLLSLKEVKDGNLADALIKIAEAEYYSNVEDYSPNTNTPLGIRRLDSFTCPEIVNPFLEELLAADRHGYATAEIRAYQQTVL